MESTLSILNRLFSEDPKLIPTKPVREYHIDKDRLELWKSLAEPYMVKKFNYIEYHFSDWLKSLAFSIDKLIEFIKDSSCSFLVSTGESSGKIKVLVNYGCIIYFIKLWKQKDLK